MKELWINVFSKNQINTQQHSSNKKNIKKHLSNKRKHLNCLINFHFHDKALGNLTLANVSKIFCIIFLFFKFKSLL